MSVVDAHGPRRAHGAPAPLDVFVAATVLDAADVHVARTLQRLAATDDELVGLAVAFAVRAVRLGSVTVDLATVAETATVDADVDVDLAALPWPDPTDWIRSVGASVLVADGDVAADRPGGEARPLRLLGTELALDRYRRHERAVASDLLDRLGRAPDDVDRDVLRAGLDRLFTGAEPDHQRLAAAAAVLRSFSVIAGGPGTGKTTTVAAVLALLEEQAIHAGRPLRAALVAPTGKAAARLSEAVHARAEEMDLDDEVRDALMAAEASTIHRLLGRAGGSRSRFRHDRRNQLPHQVVIVDETSMVSLSLMARLVEAVRPSARLVLVGDPQQLSSVEAGAVLGDIVGPAGDALQLSAAAATELEQLTGHAFPGPRRDRASIGDGIVVLRTVHRFRGGVAALAEAIEAGDAGGTVRALRGHPGEVTWLPVDGGDLLGSTDPALEVLRTTLAEPARAVVEAARRGDAAAALASMGAAQLLCAHRRGPHGASRWRTQLERWLVESVPDHRVHGWHAGRPLLVTENDYGLELFNGDAGVVIDEGDGRLTCAFERRGRIVSVRPGRLRAVETLHAMTIHKSQGSQFGHVVVVLPDPSSPILTRELLYTAVTRAERHVTVVGTEDAVRAAVARPVRRASGLRRRLWDQSVSSDGPG